MPDTYALYRSMSAKPLGKRAFSLLFASKAPYFRTVRPMHLEYVEPSKRWADLIVPEGGDNHIALDVILGKLGRVAFGNQ